MDPASILDSLDERARRELDRWTVPGLVLGVLADRRTDVRAYGVADLSTGQAVRPEMPFRIASITKPFHATLAQTLVQEGLLDLDRTLDGYRLPHAGTTERHLLSHQGALATEWPVPIGDYGDGDDCLERLTADEPLPLPYLPGELFSYSNAGFSLSGAILGRAAGTTFEEAMAVHVLAPLGLSQTGFEPYAPPAVGHVQVEPGADEHVAASTVYPRGRRPSGGLYSTASDLLGFAAHHVGGPGPLSTAARANMHAPLVTTSDGSYGLGFAIRTANGRAVVEHGGSIAGYRTLLLLCPEEGFAFVALTNSGRGHAVVNALVGELGLGKPRPAEVDAASAGLDGVAGRYRQGATEVEVSPEAGGLRVQVVETDPISGERRPLVPLRVRPTGLHTGVVEGGEENGTRIELLRPDLLRIGLRAYVPDAG